MNGPRGMEGGRQEDMPFKQLISLMAPNDNCGLILI